MHVGLTLLPSSEVPLAFFRYNPSILRHIQTSLILCLFRLPEIIPPPFWNVNPSSSSSGPRGTQTCSSRSQGVFSGTIVVSCLAKNNMASRPQSCGKSPSSLFSNHHRPLFPPIPHSSSGITSLLSVSTFILQRSDEFSTK